jgi:hypothetical protein
MDASALSALIIAGILALERMLSKIKKCKSGCVDIEMKKDPTEPSSPKNSE